MPSAVPRVLAGLAVVPFLLGAAAAPDPDGTAVLHFADARITESSGLVVLPSGLFVTTNDSGDTGRVFTVDRRGRTVGVTDWSPDAVDVEALAPAGRDAVWVGDIGDNRSARDSVQVARVPVGPGERRVDVPVYDLVYPDGAHDAETLLAAPDGRLYVVTKGFLGGTVYLAPERLDAGRRNRLRQVGAPGRVLPLATDGAVLPDGRHAVVRGYAGAVLYDFPSFDRVRAIPLPPQPQGEGLAVAADGTVYLSTEGSRSAVLRLPEPVLPPGSAGPSSAAGSGSAGPSSRPSSGAPGPSATDGTAEPAEATGGWWPWALGGVVGLAVVGVLLRSLRPR